jgi:hypothetical protein
VLGFIFIQIKDREGGRTCLSFVITNRVLERGGMVCCLVMA